MHALYEQGATLREVAERYGISASYVSRLFRNAGLKVRPQGAHAGIRKPTYPDEELLAFLAEASAGSGEPLSARAYERFAQDRLTADGRP